MSNLGGSPYPYSPQGQPTPQRSAEYGSPQWNAYPQPVQGQIVPAPTGFTPYQGPLPAPTNALAIAALVTSLLGMAIVPVVLGHLSLGQIARSGESGRGLAIAGLIIGYASIAFWLLIMLMVLGLAAASMG